MHYYVDKAFAIKRFDRDWIIINHWSQLIALMNGYELGLQWYSNGELILLRCLT